MAKRTNIRKIYIEASPIVEKHLSGIGHATVELIRGLERQPIYGELFEVVIVVPYDKLHTLDRWKFKNSKVKTVPIPLRWFNLAWKFNLLPPMDLLLGKGIYVFPNYKNWWLLFSKSITYVHDISFILFPEFVSPKNQKFLKKNMPRWLHRTTLVVTVSQSAKQEIIDYYHIPEDKTKMLYHGVDGAVYYPRSQEEINVVKERYGISGKYIFYIGNIEPRKNIERMIKAYRQLNNTLRDEYALVLIGGSGWLNDSIIESIKQAQADGFRIIKPSTFVVDEDLPALHSGASVLLHPALYEGFGLSLVQAMACGTPVIAGNNSSMPEVVGKAGVLVEVNDVGAITSALTHLLENDTVRESLGKEGILQAKKFSWDQTAKLLVDAALRFS